MKRLTAIVAALLVVAGLFYLGSRSGGEPGPESSPSPQATGDPTETGNPVGLFLNPRLLDAETRVRLAEEMGVRYFRSFPVLVPNWDGRCEECELVHRAGLDFVLTFRNAPDFEAPSDPVTDLERFQEVVREAVALYRPALVVVENEEQVPAHNSATAEEYAEELRAACEVAHSLETPCTNGGLLSGSVTSLVYVHYLETDQPMKAQSFMDRALEDFQQRQVVTPEGLDQVRGAAEIVGSFVDLYAEAGADYINFHWYIEDGEAMREAVDHLEQLTGLPAITNEVGQRTVDPADTTEILQGIRDLDLDFAVWYSADARLARALVERDGALRETGEAFRDFVLGTWVDR